MGQTVWVAEIASTGVIYKDDSQQHMLGVYSSAELGKAAVERVLSAVQWEHYVLEHSEYYGTNESYEYLDGFAPYATWWVAVYPVDIDVDHDGGLMPNTPANAVSHPPTGSRVALPCQRRRQALPTA